MSNANSVWVEEDFRAKVTDLPLVLAQAVQRSTHRIVDDALRGRWTQVLDGAEQRRRMLETLEVEETDVLPLSSMEALRAAVYESDQAIARIVAHALVQSQLGADLESAH